jgi:hypothetical protein
MLWSSLEVKEDDNIKLILISPIRIRKFSNPSNNTDLIDDSFWLKGKMIVGKIPRFLNYETIKWLFQEQLKMEFSFDLILGNIFE